MKYAKHIVPWLIAVGIIVYLFHVYSFKEILHAFKYINIYYFVIFAVVYFLVVYIVDSVVIKKAFSLFSYDVDYKDVFIARGVTYLIMIVNYPASQAGFAYYLKRQSKIPIFSAIGVFLIIVFIDLFWLINLAFFGSFFQTYQLGPINLGETVRMVAIMAYAIFFAWIIFWHFIAPRIHSKNIWLISKLLKRQAFEIFSKAKFIDYVKITVWRTPIHLMILLSMYVVVRTFNAFIPLTQIMGNMPLVFMVGTLPITPGGLGTTNAALVELLSPHISGAVLKYVGAKQLLLAASLAWVFFNYFLKAVIGLILMSKASRKMFRETTIPEEKVEKEAAHLGGNI